MGFTNSPADLAKVLDQVFGDLILKAYHYVDDFIVISATFNEHTSLLRGVAIFARGNSLESNSHLAIELIILSEPSNAEEKHRLQPTINFNSLLHSTSQAIYEKFPAFLSVK